MKVRELVRLLEKNGWTQVRARGDHRHFQHPEIAGTLTVAGNASKDVPPGTLARILRDAGLKGEDR